MGDIRYDPNDINNAQLSFGTIADYVSGLTADPSAEPRPSLSELFTSKGVDAGLVYHNGPAVYAEANPWTLNETIAPAEGVDGTLIKREGFLSFGVESDLQDRHVGYVEGKYSVTFGHAGWTPPETVRGEYPVYDDDGNQIGVEEYVDEFDGYHAYDEGVTTLSLIGNANTAGEYHFAGVAEHDRTISLAGRDFDINALGAIGIDHDYGAFATGGVEAQTLIHEGTNTSLYAGASVLFAQNDEYNHQFLEAGVQTGVLDKVTGINAMPDVRLGTMYDGQDVKPTLGVGWSF